MHRFLKKYSAMLIFAAVCIVIMIYAIDSVREDKNSVVINEVCLSNLSSVSDDKGEYNDWVELYNPSDSDVDLTGYHISRKKGLNSGYALDDITIPAKGYKIIFPKITLPSEGVNLYLASASGRILDEVNVPELKYDTSWARVTDGGSEWDRVEPTPEMSNNDAARLKGINSAEVKFSSDSGFYDYDFLLYLEAPEGYEIKYTLDGSDPTEDSETYVEPIEIRDLSSEENVYANRTDGAANYLSHYEVPDLVDKAMVVRAAAFDASGSMGKIATRIYFIGYDKRSAYDDMSVVSVVTDPDNLFSYENGIYVKGKVYDDYISSGASKTYDKADIWWWTPGNYQLRGPESEREAAVSIFDENHIEVLSCTLGLRIRGGGSRGYAQKSFNLFARKAYGNEYFESTLLEGDKSEKSISLFSGGDDINTKLKDMLIARLTKSLHLKALTGKPAAVFLDGEYWGLYWLSDRLSPTYFENKFGVSPENVILIKSNELAVGKQEDKALYDEMNVYITHHDFADPAVYERFKEMVDIDSLLDYFAAQMYIAHTDDWPGSNIGLWRVRDKGKGEYEDGRWRFVIFDVNSSSMDLENVGHNTIKEVSEKSYMIKALMASPQFRADLADRIEKLSRDIFNADEVANVIDDMARKIRPQMQLTFDRYYGSKRSIERFDSDVEELKQFYAERYGYISKYIQEMSD